MITPVAHNAAPTIIRADGRLENQEPEQCDPGGRDAGTESGGMVGRRELQAADHERRHPRALEHGEQNALQPRLAADRAELQYEVRQKKQGADAEAQQHEVLRRKRAGDARAGRHGIRRPDQDGNDGCGVTAHREAAAAIGQPLLRRRRTEVAYAATGRCGSRFGLTIVRS